MKRFEDGTKKTLGIAIYFLILIKFFILSVSTLLLSLSIILLWYLLTEIRKM
ncbi:hypothetical protein GCM10008931_30490 [Oceanobacillus oncorhynchi subsp. oncorhynchi]